MNRSLKAASFVHYASIFAVVAYLVVGEVVWATAFEKRSLLNAGDSIFVLLRVVVYVWGLANMGVALLFKREKHWLRLVQTVNSKWIVLSMYVGPIVTFLALRAAIWPPSTHSRRVNQEHLMSASVVLGILCITTGIGGLVLFILGGQRIDLYILGVLATVVLVIMLPRKARWESTLRELTGT